jgi:hypothetical protein
VVALERKKNQVVKVIRSVLEQQLLANLRNDQRILLQVLVFQIRANEHKNLNFLSSQMS